jgi:hypothetical protein
MAQQKIIPGKDVGNNPGDIKDTTNLNFDIQDDESNAGAGMPVTMALCRKIVHEYCKRQDALFTLLSTLTPSTQLTEVLATVSPINQVISGIYGRDTIMHLLEQEGCEGIMYVNGIYDDKDTIVLIGVDKNGIPIGGKAKFATDVRPLNDAVIYEVKGGGKRQADVLEIMPI